MDTIAAAEARRWWSRVGAQTHAGRDTGLQLRRSDRGLARTDPVDGLRKIVSRI